MSDRRCGYCREYNHNSKICPTKLKAIQTVREHVGLQRYDVANLFIQNGFGVGAIVTAHSYDSEEPVPCLVTQDSFDNYQYMTPLEWNLVKYSKRVYARLVNYSGNGIVSMEDIHTIYRAYVSLKVIPMSGNQPYLHAQVHMSDLKNGVGANPYAARHKTQDSWIHYSDLLSPSHDGEVNIKTLSKPFSLHRRLGGGVVLPLFPGRTT